MKKIVCLIMSAAMVTTISVSALAAKETDKSNKTNIPVVTENVKKEVKPTAEPKQEKQNVEIKALMEAYKAEVTPLKESITLLEVDLETAITANDEEQISAIEAEIKAIADQIKAKRDALRAEIKNLKKGTEEVVAADKVKENEKKLALDAFKAEIAPLRDKIAELEVSLEAAIEANDEAQITALEEQIKAVNDEIKAKRDALKEKVSGPKKETVEESETVAL